MGDSRCSYGGGAWNPSYGGPHGLSGPAAMAPSYGPHRLHPAAIVPARHRSIPYDPPANAPPRIIYQSGSIPAKGPDVGQFSMDYYHGGYGQDWGEDDDDDDDGEPIICRICNRESEHVTLNCPFITLTNQLDGLRRTPPGPPEEVSYYFYQVVDENTQRCADGSGLWMYRHPGRRAVEHCAADAKMLHKDGMNLVRITNLPKDIAEPELLYKFFVTIGPLRHVVVFPDQALAFVNFVAEEAAQTAIKLFNCSGLGHLMWATQRP